MNVQRLMVTNTMRLSNSYPQNGAILSLAKQRRPHYLVICNLNNTRYCG